VSVKDVLWSFDVGGGGDGEDDAVAAAIEEIRSYLKLSFSSVVLSTLVVR
jgi:hypothetical protein